MDSIRTLFIEHLSIMDVFQINLSDLNFHWTIIHGGLYRYRVDSSDGLIWQMSPIAKYPLDNVRSVGYCYMTGRKKKTTSLLSRIRTTAMRVILVMCFILEPTLLTGRSCRFSAEVVYDSFSDVGESRVWFASKNLTPCRMHWNDFLIAQIIAKCHSFPNLYDML